MTGSLHPRARLLAIAVGVVGVFLTPTPVQLALLWICAGIPMLWRTHMLKVHLRFLLFVVFPLSLTLFLIWGVIMGAGPGALPHSSPRRGMEFAALITLRVVTLGVITQAGLLSLGSDGLISLCSQLGLPHDLRIMTVGATILIPEMRLRAAQVYTARCARGFLKTRGLFDRVKQLPAMLRALVAWALRSAVDRSEMWTHRRLLSREHRNVVLGPFCISDYVAIAAPGVWVIYNLVRVVAR